jgi:hypothetical protein
MRESRRNHGQKEEPERNFITLERRCLDEARHVAGALDGAAD